MLSSFRSTRYANIVSTLALLFALTGTAAATGLPALITGQQIKNGSITGQDLADHSIGADKLATGVISDLRPVAGSPGPAGAQGPAGPAGPQGAAGADGAAGTGITLAGYAKTDDQSVAADSNPHAIWSINLNSQATRLFILTGAIGGAQIPGGCNTGGSETDQLLVDGAPSGFNGGFLTLTAGPHTLTYEVTDDCAGQPADVPAQEAALIPFTLPS
jgi:hypothetical protein